VEGVVIVGSILLAFGIEALWSERLERRDERAAIAQLSADFRSNADRLAAIKGIHQQALDASYEILAIADLGGQRRGSHSTPELVLLSLRTWTYDPALGGINSLVQSGRLDILRNDSLRVAVAAWPDIVQDLNEDERFERTFLFERLSPYLMTRGVMLDMLASNGRLDGIVPRPDADIELLISDSFYLEQLSWRVNSLQNLLEELEAVEASTQRILHLLEGG
jgi:hypothetical protein